MKIIINPAEAMKADIKDKDVEKLNDSLEAREAT